MVLPLTKPFRRKGPLALLPLGGTRGAGVKTAVATLLLCAGASPVFAAPPSISVPITSQPDGQKDSFSFLSNLERSNFFLGDMFGLRPTLGTYGMTVVVQETSEVLGNVSGGMKKGAAYDGLTQLILQMDTQRAFGYYGGLFNMSVLNLHGTNFSAENLGSLQTSSGIASNRATRLWELWYEQKFLEEDRLSVRVGQQSADQEFIVSSNALFFVNTMMGWPAVPSYDLPGGGPAYPLSAPAIRARYRFGNAWNLLVGVFNGSPAKTNEGDAQEENNHGTSFPMHNGTLTFMELQYVYPSVGSLVYPGEKAPLSRTYKLGAWYNSQPFDHLRYDQNGLSLANPASNGTPATAHGNLSIYAVADQMLWRNDNDPNNTISAFTRIMGTPKTDRNPISFSMNAGLVCRGPIKNRANDTLAVGMGFVRVSSQAAGLDRDTAQFAQAAGDGGYYPVRSSETFIEATYQCQVTPWLQIQPDIQYVWNPGGGIANPNAPTQRIGNELVLGVRANILF
ncbi:carbohydrate porin [Geothrix sp. 21YS21S-4]|uniref:carbohydrate porin n=1 Tax=Geothrix sp. 21YS21S-4 TaxID=3068889 RepID=UPI00359390E0